MWPSLCLPLITLLVVPHLIRCFSQFPSGILGSPLGGERQPHYQPLLPWEQHPDLGTWLPAHQAVLLTLKWKKSRGKRQRKKKKSGRRMQRDVLEKNPGSFNYCCVYLLIMYLLLVLLLRALIYWAQLPSQCQGPGRGLQGVLQVRAGLHQPPETNPGKGPAQVPQNLYFVK